VICCRQEMDQTNRSFLIPRPHSTGVGVDGMGIGGRSFCDQTW